MFVYYQKRFTATISSSELKDIKCEHCQATYHFEHAATGKSQAIALYGIGSDRAAANAADSALRIARSRLRRTIPPVVCPECRQVQANMLPGLRRQFLYQFEKWGVQLPAILALISVGAALLVTNFFSEPMPRSGTSIVLIAAFGLLAAVGFVLFGVLPWLKSRNFTTKNFEPMIVPVGTKGPAPLAQLAPK